MAAMRIMESCSLLLNLVSLLDISGMKTMMPMMPAAAVSSPSTSPDGATVYVTGTGQNCVEVKLFPQPNVVSFLLRIVRSNPKAKFEESFTGCQVTHEELRYTITAL